MSVSPAVVLVLFSCFLLYYWHLELVTVSLHAYAYQYIIQQPASNPAVGLFYHILSETGHHALGLFSYAVIYLQTYWVWAKYQEHVFSLCEAALVAVLH